MHKSRTEILNASTKMLNIKAVIQYTLQMAGKADVCKNVPSKFWMSISFDINQTLQLTDTTSPH